MGQKACPPSRRGGMAYPLMGADMARVDDLKRIVAADPRFRGRKVEIVRFGTRESIGTIDRTSEGRASVAKPTTR